MKGEGEGEELLCRLGHLRVFGVEASCVRLLRLEHMGTPLLVELAHTRCTGAAAARRSAREREEAGRGREQGGGEKEGAERGRGRPSASFEVGVRLMVR